MNTTKNSGCGPALSVKCIEATNRIEAEPGHKLKKKCINLLNYNWLME